MDNERRSHYDFLLVLDFEAVFQDNIYEITDFPVLLLDAKGEIKSIFHQFVRPQVISRDRVDSYINHKYGAMGLSEEWTEKAIQFPDALSNLHQWMSSNELISLKEEANNNSAVSSTYQPIKRFAFVTCGDWDLGHMLPSNCKLTNTPVPSFMREWINIKEIFGEHYGKKKRKGMKAMLEAMAIPLEGHHHSGLDDCKNIAKIVHQLLLEGATFHITGDITELSSEENNNNANHHSDFKVHRNRLDKSKAEDTSEKSVESTPAVPKVKEVYLFKNGVKFDESTKETIGKKKQITTADWKTFVKQCSNKVAVKAKKVYRQDGTEIMGMDQINHGDCLFLSAGEAFVNK